MQERYMRWVNHFSLLIMGVSTMIAGSVLLHYFNVASSIITLLLSIYLISTIFAQIVILFRPSQRTKTTIITIILGVIALALLVFERNLPFHIILFGLGGYIFVNGVVQIIQYWIDFQEKIPGRIVRLTKGLILNIVGLVLLGSPWMELKYPIFILSLYLIISGAFQVFDAIFNWLPSAALNTYKRRIRITPPVIVEALIPKIFLEELNAYLAPRDEQTGRKEPRREIPISDYLEKHTDTVSNLKVMIHVTDKSFGQVGHMDVTFKDKVTSYGAYDSASYVLGGLISDGVLIETDSAEYIEFCKNEGKTLFVFSIITTAQEDAQIAAEILELQQQGYRWQSNFERTNDASIIDPKDYGSRLVYYTHAKLFKFAQGKFKKYFGLTTNCVMVADQILGPTGSNLLKNTGILTPGTYLSYLYGESQKEDGKVSSLQILRN